MVPQRGKQNFEVVLVDQDTGERRACNVVDGHDGILWVQVDGYGDRCTQSGQGLPIGIGLNGGRLEVYLWDDINKDDHKTFSMEGARESAREED